MHPSITPIDLAKRLLRGGLSVGAPRSAGPLTLVPLFGGAPGPRYLVGGEAFEQGLLTISEAGGVPALLATNSSDRAVLLLDGEHLQGAKQDRILNASVLLASRRETVLPVSCVEHGRWAYGERADFAPAPAFAHGNLRAREAEAVVASARLGRGRVSDQEAVWDSVAQHQVRVGVAGSRTGAMGDAWATHRGSVDRLLGSLPGPEPDQTGVAACIEGRPVVVDVFDRPGTLSRVWRRLVSGYLMDTLGRTPIPVNEGLAVDLLTMAAEGDATSHVGVGLGTDVVLTSREAVGNALVWEGAAVHLALFRRAERPALGTARFPRSPDGVRSRRFFHER